MVPVLVLDVTEEEADKILLTFDPLAAMATADSDAVKRLLETVRTDSRAVGALLEQVAGQKDERSNGLGELVDPPAQVDKAAELQAKWGTQAGQAWQIGPHRLVCGDCREKADDGRLWADSGPKLRIVWTDPPYGVDYAAKNAYLNRSDRGNRIQTPIENDRLSAGEDRDHVQTGAQGCKAVCRREQPAMRPCLLDRYSSTSFRHLPRPASPTALN